MGNPRILLDEGQRETERRELGGGGSTHARVVSVCTYIPPDIREKVVHITISLLSLEPRDPVRTQQHTSIEDK